MREALLLPGPTGSGKTLLGEALEAARFGARTRPLLAHPASTGADLPALLRG